MSVPESHSDILEEEARSILSTFGPNNEIFSGFCFIRYEDDQILLSSIDDEQMRYILTNAKVSILIIDPSNVDRWFCIQGTISPINIKESHFQVKIREVIKFPKEG